MMHYSKGENVEKEIKREDLPFEDCLPKGQEDFLWMHVNGGTKVNNVITFAKNALDKGEHRTIVWSGHGGGVVKTVSCAEIMKRSHPLYQVTRMDYKITEEHWLPQMDGLEEIVVTRKVPALHILMSLDAIDVEGVQKPNTKTDYWNDTTPSSSRGALSQENSSRRQNQRHQNHGQRQRKFKRKDNNQQQEANDNTVEQNKTHKRKHSFNKTKQYKSDNSDNRENKKTTEPQNT